jgi:uncharacterized protein (DUF111 family)
VVVIEAEIDDMNPQIFGVVMDQLLADGALDVFYTAIQMKKNRPGTLLTVVAPPDARERLTGIIFRESTDDWRAIPGNGTRVSGARMSR